MPKTRKDSRKTGIWPLSYLGVEPVAPPLLLTNNRAPTTSDYKNFNVGTWWIDRSTAPSEDVWILVNKDNNVARWIKFFTGISQVETLTGNVGGPVGPDSLQNIDVVGAGPYIVTGNPAAWTLTIDDDGTIADQYTTNLGVAVPVANNLNVLGGTYIATVGVGDTITIDTTADVAAQYTTDLGVAVPVANNLNVLGGTYITTTGVGDTITIDTSGAVASSFVTDAGIATPAAGVLNVLGGELIGTTGAGNTVTANLDRGTNGQVIIAATGATSAYANITSGDGSVAITNGPNTVDLSVATSSDPPIFGYSNLGMTVDTGASTISIHSASGAALSIANSAKITFASKATPGTSVTITVVANVVIDWSDMDGNTMGTEGSKAWADDMPLYVYAVLNDAENDCTFGLARVPHHVASGATANIGTPSSATADNLLSLFLFENVTIGLYDDNPVVVLGAVTATKDASDQWSFSAVKGGTTGIGGLQVGSKFSSPATQMGANNNHVGSNGGTIPTFTSSNVNYAVTPDGFLNFSFACNALSVIGVGVNVLNVITPFNASNGITDAGICCVGDAAASVAALRGVYRAIPSSVTMPGGFTTGILFVKNEVRRLQCADFDTVNASGSNLTGSISFLITFNILP